MAIRGLYTTGSDRLFAVAGNKFVEVFKSGTFKQYGKLVTNSGKVDIAESVNTDDNTTQLMIVDGLKGYIFQVDTGTFSQITSEGYLVGSSVVFFNGYFVQNVVGQNKFIYSSLYDGLTWSAIDVYVAEGNADNVSRVDTVNNELWVFGNKSLEIWYATGDSDDPFARVNNAFINIGLGAKDSVGVLTNSICWLGSNSQGNNIVWQANSYIPQRISDHSIEYIIGQMDDPSDCVAYVYQQEGHQFYVMNFYSGNKTLVYDLVTGMWHERGYYNEGLSKNEVHRVGAAVLWDNKVIGGDWINNNIYELDLDTYTDNGSKILRYRQGGHLHNDRKRLFFREFELDLERGVGNVSGDGADPKVMLTWSDDGGRTWSNGYWASAGKIGEYLTSVSWHKLGQSRDRVFRVQMSDPVKWILIGATIDVEKGDS